MQGRFEAERAAVILDDPRLANLRYLDLSSNRFDADEIRLLAQSLHFGQVRNLNLSQTHGGAGGLLHLFQSRTLRQVRRLSYSGAGGRTFTDIVAGEEVSRPTEFWSNLHRLYLSGKWLGDAGFRWMLSSGILGSVRELWTPDADLTHPHL